MYMLFLLLAGLLQGLMVSLNGQLALYFSSIEVSFFVHGAGVILLLLYMLLIEKKRPHFGGAPAYVYTVGFLGIAMISTSSFCTSHIGAATVTAGTCHGTDGDVRPCGSFRLVSHPAGVLPSQKTPRIPADDGRCPSHSSRLRRLSICFMLSFLSFTAY